VIFTETVAQLERGLRAELPGAAAQARLAPVPRRQWPAGFNPARIRHAAGLLLVFPKTTGKAGEAHIVLTVRSDSVRHGGQVSLPGGVIEPGETFEQAALREAHEEVALPVEGVRVLGALTSLDIPVSGFRLHPIVAASDAHLPLTPADGEVATILEIAVDDLLDPGRFVWTERERDGIDLSIPAFHVAGHEIWGATAMVLAEFLTLLGWAGGRTT
jgi:8-oxo-dGTP pyrophosphatase MutT (NUDIX family)